MLVKEEFRVMQADGDIGIEIELEGDDFNYAPPYPWVAHNDGSLRGDSVEYVVSHPIKKEEVTGVLGILQEACRDNTILATGRAGVHVHLNCQKYTFKQVIQIITLYTILEEPLVKWCGVEREGNLFCLRSFDAEEIIFRLMTACKQGCFKPLHLGDGDLRYASINLEALRKFGSLEFRAMRSTQDFSLIATWINILWQLKEAALKFNSPREMIESLSGEGEIGFFFKTMQQYSEVLECPGLPSMLRKGARRTQNFAFINIPDIDKEVKKKKK